MANKQDDNKRVKVGLAIFALLVLANVFVHGGRMFKQAAVTPQSVVSLPSQSGQPAVIVNPGNVSAVLAEGPEQYFDKQTNELREALKKQKLRLEKIAEPLPPPDLAAELVLSDNDFFRWRSDGLAPQTIASAPVQALEAMTILGHFRIGNKTKLLVRTASISFIVDENNDGSIAEVSLVHEEGDSFVIKDDSGKTRVLQLDSSPDKRLQSVIDTLRGKKNQPRYPLLPGGRP